MLPWAQPDLPLFDPLEPRILPQDAGAWFTINRLTDGGMKQRPYRLELIETVLRALGASLDTYMSQGLFAVPRRRAVHLAWLTHAYVDLDCYRAERWRGLPPDDMVREILWHCADAGIPPPSIILSSGRGYYCKWFWSQPVPRTEAGRALSVNRNLCRTLAAFCADPNAVDVSRILRVLGTLNGKNGKLVAIVWINGPPGAPTTYDFDTFARNLPRPNIDDFDAEEGRLPRGYRPRLGLHESRRLLWSWQERQRYTFSREHWHWGVLEDIRTLATMRFPGGIVQPGKRDLYGHLAACQIARVIRPGPLFHEISEIARTFLPAGYVDGTDYLRGIDKDDFRKHCSTLLRRAMHAAEGQLVEFDGKLRTPVYTYSKPRLMDLLEIEPAEERDMIRLISDGEKRRRETDRRRAAGVMERDAYEGRSAERQAQAVAMRAQGMTQKAIAAELGISQARVSQMLAEPGGI